MAATLQARDRLGRLGGHRRCPRRLRRDLVPRRVAERDRLPEKLLSKEEQAKTVNQMVEKAQTQQAEAAKEIEKGKQ